MLPFRMNPRRNPDDHKWVLVDDIKHAGGGVERIYNLDIGERDTYYDHGPVPEINVGLGVFVIGAVLHYRSPSGEEEFAGWVKDPQSWQQMFNAPGSSLEEVKSKVLAEVRRMQKAARGME